MIPIFLTDQPPALSHPDEVVTQLKDCTKAMCRYPLHFCEPVDLAYLRDAFTTRGIFGGARGALKINRCRERRLGVEAPRAAESTKTETTSDKPRPSSTAQCVGR